jgi:hypothetical protein
MKNMVQNGGRLWRSPDGLQFVLAHKMSKSLFAFGFDLEDPGLTIGFEKKRKYF